MPVFGFDHIGIAAALGLNIVIAFFKDHKFSKRYNTERLEKALALVFAKAVFYLLLGGTASLFI